MDSVLEVGECGFSLNFLDLASCVFLNEFLDADVTAANSDLNVTLFNLDEDASLAEAVNTFALPEEHDFHLVSLGVVVCEMSKGLVDVVMLARYVLVLENVVLPFKLADSTDHFHLKATFQVLDFLLKFTYFFLALVILFGAHVLLELKRLHQIVILFSKLLPLIFKIVL